MKTPEQNAELLARRIAGEVMGQEIAAALRQPPGLGPEHEAFCAALARAERTFRLIGQAGAMHALIADLATDDVFRPDSAYGRRIAAILAAVAGDAAP